MKRGVELSEKTQIQGVPLQVLLLYSRSVEKKDDFAESVGPGFRAEMPDTVSAGRIADLIFARLFRKRCYGDGLELLYIFRGVLIFFKLRGGFGQGEELFFGHGLFYPGKAELFFCIELFFKPRLRICRDQNRIRIVKKIVFDRTLIYAFAVELGNARNGFDIFSVVEGISRLSQRGREFPGDQCRA